MLAKQINRTIIPEEIIHRILEDSGLELSSATIRETKKLVDLIEAESGIPFIRMEMGIPGLPANQIGLEAEIEALKAGVASKYPNINGIELLKKESVTFIKNFLNIDISPESCVPTVGSMQASFTAFMTVNKRKKGQDVTLLIDPGFPVHKQQLNILGLKHLSFDIYDYRGKKLEEKLRSFLDQGNISCMLYSNPNNPSWICFTEEELKIIGHLATEYDVVVLEDLAYFGMDFRRDISRPGEAPYQNTVAQFTDNWILLISSSKVFSYAGQRMGLLAISDTLYKQHTNNLKKYYSTSEFGHSLVYGTLYALSAGTSHSAQYALAAMFKAANEGRLNIVQGVKAYELKAKTMKKLFLENGFQIVYAYDMDQAIADGFYFTVSYPGMSGEELLKALLHFGISAISLKITGSTREEGIRACVSLIQEEQFPELARRLQAFHTCYKERLH